MRPQTAFVIRFCVPLFTMSPTTVLAAAAWVSRFCRPPWKMNERESLQSGKESYVKLRECYRYQLLPVKEKGFQSAAGDSGTLDLRKQVV
jgi:hypothetical protein